jgi:hypothetical protein
LTPLSRRTDSVNMDPANAPPAPVGRYGKPESLAPTDPTERPPSPGLGSQYSRQTHLSLQAFAARDALRRRRILTCAGLTAALLLLAALLAFFLFPRPPAVSAATPTFALAGVPTPAAFSATFSVLVSVDNSASWAPWGLKDIAISAFSVYSNAAMVTAAAGAPISVPARSVKAYAFTLGVNTGSGTAGINQVALLSCAQAILAGSGCSARLRITGTPTYLGVSFSPRTFDANLVLR